MTLARCSALFSVALTCLLAQNVAAQPSGEKTLLVARAPAPPAIDGRIDAGEWAAATVIEDFHQVEPVEFAPASERTRVYVMIDADNIYVAARMWDSQPDQVAARSMRQGEELNDDDVFGVALDTFNDRRNGYWFAVNPNGVRRQAIFQNTTTRNFDWRGIWHTMSSRDSEGWVTEIAIPVKTLTFNPDSDTWGINFRRKIERRQEFMAWVSRNRQVNPSASGIATGMTGFNQGIGLDLVPSISLKQQRTFDPANTDRSVEPSLDVFYKITPALTAALTINTDFSATEVDDREVNLTRFGLFFPEKRAFFLQGADIFEFGRLTNAGNDTEISGSSLANGRPFFSRRIGLSGRGEPVDLDVGGKMTGRIGSWNVGLLDVAQSAYGPVDSRNLFVGRAVANVLEESSLGLILTNGDPRSNLSNTVVGADFLYQNTRLGSGSVVEAEAWYQQSSTEGVTGDDAAYGLRIGMPNEAGFRAGAGMKVIEQNFYPALGFVNNAGIRDYTFETRYTKRMGGYLQAAYGTLDVQRIELIEGGLQSQVATLRPLVLESSSGEQLELNYIASKEVLYEPFEISDGVVLPPGEYSFDEAKVAFETGGHRALSGTIRLAQGDFYSGERVNIEGELTWRPSRYFALAGQYEYFGVDLPQGSFVTRLVQVRTDVAFSSRLSWSNLMQYDNDSEVMGFNSRLQWVPEMGRETYLVFNHELEDADRNNRFRSTNADLVVKLGYTYRL
ncbi:MAG: DUF5916 domain-containing protein [Steroidobacteraceae bacterium]